MNWILERFLGRKVARATQAYLQELTVSAREASQAKTAEFLRQMATKPGLKIKLGNTLWERDVLVPVEEVIKAFSLCTGGTGSGKSFFALGLLEQLIEVLPYGSTIGFGVIDPKADLFLGTLFLLQKRLELLAQQDPHAARELRRRIVIYDFSSRDPVTSYNILARWPNAEADFFAANRADLLLDLLSGSDKVSLGGAALLQKVLLLLSEFHLPITYLERLLHDDDLRLGLLERCQNSSVKTYFSRQFTSIPRPTVAALSRRMEALFSSEGVRLALSGNTAPDFRKLQDEGKIVLVNCFGRNIARGVRRLLQGLVLSDIRQGIFTRQKRNNCFIWLADEAQNFFITEKLRDNITDVLTMARSFGTYFLFLTHNMYTAVGDSRLLKVLHTNIRWSFSMRGESSDCEFLKPFLPVTGRKPKPHADPFSERTFYSIAEERALALEAIAGLPDRTGYLWFRTGASGAFKIKTSEVLIPQGQDLEMATKAARRDPGLGARLSRREYERIVIERDRQWQEKEQGDLAVNLEQAYQRTRR